MLLSIEGTYLLLYVLVALTAKHFVADFPLQNKFMLRKTNVNGWQIPLLTHAGVHGVLTALVLFPVLGWEAILFGIGDFGFHLIIDFWKSRFARYHPFEKMYWVAFGVDQLLHQVTYIAIAVIVYQLTVGHVC